MPGVAERVGASPWMGGRVCPVVVALFGCGTPVATVVVLLLGWGTPVATTRVEFWAIAV
jgi:hypothetical protein